MVIFYLDKALYVKHSYSPGFSKTYYDPPSDPDISIEDIFLNEESIYDLMGDKQLQEIEQLLYNEYTEESRQNN